MKLLLVCNPGGHFSTMMSLKKFWSAHEREWVTYRHFDTERLEGREIVHWVIKQEAREFWRACVNSVHALQIVHKSRPDLILSTGAGLAVPFVVAGKLFGIQTVFIESISRAYELSLSGKILYNLVDELYVQWPECTERNPRAQYRGVVL
jgi:UDP-N-acetylglucosamine:LPS N-acetylglucosamine transferase